MNFKNKTYSARLFVGLFLAALLIVLAACQTPTPIPPTASPPTPIPTIQASALIGRPVKDDHHGSVYIFSPDGNLQLIDDLPTFNALGFQIQDIETIPQDQLRSFPASMPLTRWLTGTTDHNLYFIDHDQRYKIDPQFLASTGGSVYDVSLVTDSFLNGYPLAPGSLPDTAGINQFAAEMQTPVTQASVWQGSSLWIAHATGGLMRWQAG